MALDNKLGYTHFFSGQVPLDWNWESKAKFNLVTNVLELHQILSENKGKTMAVDTETTGLDLGMDKVVGFSFSFDEWKGYYVPIRHEEVSRIETEVPKIDKEGNKVLYKKTGLPQMKKITLEEYTPYNCNLDPKVALDLIYETMLNAKLVLMHNAIFDSMMIKKEDYDMSKINLFDTMVLTYNSDTNASGQFGLKPASELFLGRRAQKFKEVLGKSKTFQYINPTDCFEYACSDAINTYGLFKKLYPMLRAEGCESILKMDNALVKSFINYYTSVPIYIDKKIMREYEEEILRRKKDLEMSIYKAVGYPFNIASKSNELVKALESMGIDTGVKTDGGKMSTSKDSLLAISDKHPIAKELIELSGLEKALNTYIHKLANANSVSDENPDVGMCRVNYKLFGTASGRLASGGGAKSKVLEDDYFINLNIQNLTKPKPAMYNAVKISDDFREGILGYRFDLLGKPGSNEVKEFITNNKDAYIIEGFSPEINVRKAIRVKDDTELIASLDYNGEELKIAGILSGEPNFIEPFRLGLDVHTEMAKKLFGEANYNKEKRKAAKVCLGDNSFVLTNRGLVRPYSLLSTDKIIDRFEREQDFIYAEDFSDTIEVLYDSGIVEEYKTDHPVLTWDGDKTSWKKVGDLTGLDQVLTRTNIHKGSRTSKIVNLKEYYKRKFKNMKDTLIDMATPEFAYIAGLYLGDGSIDYSNKEDHYVGVTLGCSDKVLTRVLPYLSSLGLGKLTPYKVGKNKVLNILKLNNRPLAEVFEINFGRKESKKIPDWIYTHWDSGCLTNFISGLLDSDGTRKGNRLFFGNKNMNIINNFALTCSLLGIKTRYIKETPKYKGIPFDFHTLVLYEIGDVNLNLSNDYKNVTKSKYTNISWNCTSKLADILHSKVFSIPKTSKTIRDNIYNIKKKGCGLTRNVLTELESLGIILDISGDYQPSKVISKKMGNGRIHAIQTTHREYVSSCIVSHNCNFGMLYGGSPNVLRAVAASQGLILSEKESKELFNKWWRANSILKSWIQTNLDLIKENNFTVKDMFGRPRRVKSYLCSEEKGVYNFGCRSIPSHQIQGSGSSIIRRLTINLEKKVFSNPVYKDRARFISEVHDEMNVAFKKENIIDDVRMLEDEMIYKPKGSPIPIDCSIELGNNLGELFGFVWETSERLKLIPKRA